jgi:hypothetical protein
MGKVWGYCDLAVYHCLPLPIPMLLGLMLYQLGGTEARGMESQKQITGRPTEPIAL